MFCARSVDLSLVDAGARILLKRREMRSTFLTLPDIFRNLTKMPFVTKYSSSPQLLFISPERGEVTESFGPCPHRMKRRPLYSLCYRPCLILRSVKKVLTSFVSMLSRGFVAGSHAVDRTLAFFITDMFYVWDTQHSLDADSSVA